MKKARRGSEREGAREEGRSVRREEGRGGEGGGRRRHQLTDCLQTFQPLLDVCTKAVPPGYAQL